MTGQLPLRPTWVEVDLDKLAGNIKAFKDYFPETTEIMAVVKADAYGHGVKMVAETALETGVSYLGAALLEEGIELRQAGIDAPILILGYLSPQEVAAAAEYNLTITVFSKEVAAAVIAEGSKRGAPIPVHVKIDTGMNRIGVFPEQAMDLIRRLADSEEVFLEGIFTHFAAADDEDSAYTNRQMEIFNKILHACEQENINIPIRHAGNSAGAMLFSGSRLDMIRLGISMYGYYPNPDLQWPLVLSPVASWYAKLVHIKEVRAGTAISYGCTFITDRETIVGTLPVGYGDGYWRVLSNQGNVIVGGQKAPVIGRVCMDQTMIDLTGIKKSVKIGDPVVLMGYQGKESIYADEIASQAGTISYEVLTSLGRRVPRVYIKDGRQYALQSLLQKP